MVAGIIVVASLLGAALVVGVAEGVLLPPPQLIAVASPRAPINRGMTFRIPRLRELPPYSGFLDTFYTKKPSRRR
jgi:hypothetical protein